MLFGRLKKIFRSARQTEAEWRHPHVRRFIQDLAEERFPHDPSMWLPDKPMRFHHYHYFRERYLRAPGMTQGLIELHEEVAAAQATEQGLGDPVGPGSWTHPARTRAAYADGKVVKPLYKAKPGTTRVNKSTGEIRRVRAERDAKLHTVGGGNQEWGVKFEILSCRGPEVHQRVILSVGHVDKGGEPTVLLEMLDRVASRLPGTQALSYDGALRGIHIDRILREHGIIPVSPVTAAAAGDRNGEGRVARTVHVGPGLIQRSGARAEECQLYSHDGALGLGELDEQGEIAFTRLERRVNQRRPNANGTYRWYVRYRVPDSHGGGTLTESHVTSDEDRRRGFNRTEHVRILPPGDPDYDRLRGRRSDAESINRGLNDSMYLSRAHSVGKDRQLLDLLDYAACVNALSIDRHRCRANAPPGRVAA